MATLLLTAVGTALGGPLGGALGALVGRQVDAAIIGGRKVEGPRLKELSVQTSSYGTAIPAHFGSMRAAGSVIWATELVENRERQGGGKGRPAVTTYSYSASFAVAIASRPIKRIGRIWADGNLLRGSAGDLKVAGRIRIHDGHGDQPADPLLAQAESATRCPAFRHTAYVVFEDLALGDFGNRLPSLTFEVFADDNGCGIGDLVRHIMPDGVFAGDDLSLAGFTIDQGTAGDVLATVAEAVPLTCAAHADHVAIGLADSPQEGEPPTLPAPAAAARDADDEVKATGWARRRDALPGPRQCGVRYYDLDRDYQPGVQHGIGRTRPGQSKVLELPAAMTADDARALAGRVGRRLTQPRDSIRYRLTEMNLSLTPGTVVRVPVADGLWRVEDWEWQADGVLLNLAACTTLPASAISGDAGRINQPVDLPNAATVLHAFELPWDGSGAGAAPLLYAAASSAGAGWTGAALFADRGGGMLVPLGATTRRRAVIGTCESVLPASSPHAIDRRTTLIVSLAAADLHLQQSTLAQVLQGANRALVGHEIIQFASAEPIGGSRWRISGLLRGRGGTEWAASAHAPGERFVLLDDLITPLDPAVVGDASGVAIVATGLGDATAQTAPVVNAGMTLRPLSPVHGAARRLGDGGIELRWTRRARGAWTWLDGVDAPLNEEAELWEITYGDAAAPVTGWQTSAAMLEIGAAESAALPAAAPAEFHVRQIGRVSKSVPLSIAAPAP